MIELINIQKKYLLGNKSINALNDISIKFEEGKLYGIMGESGSGKSTLMQIIGLLIKPTSGILKIDGHKTSKLSEKNIANLRKEKLAYIFQSFNLIPTMNVTENVILPLYTNRNLTKKEKIERVNNLLNSLGIENRNKHYPNQLSGGEQQRVAIARALCNNPDIILADEPTASLDKENSIKILSIFKKLSNQKKCVIVICHDDIIKDYADEIIYLKNGRMEIIDEIN
ncbi:MAG: ABC transporter ATP-binding protein [Bacilli bacterium]|nr:ABC transporter ATP-binding protein [Bacilli bacterium]